jgi:dipeptidyl aminopeptidase/acylaminoacyl peptidase
MNTDGSNRVAVYDGSSLNYPSWSPDGSSIAFTSCYYELWIIDVDVVNGKPVGSNPTLLLNDIGGSGGPEWSPRGPYENHILFVGDTYNNLKVIHATDGDTHTLYTADTGHTIWYPVWSPDGDKIAFMEWNGEHHALKILDVSSEGVTTVVEPFIGKCLDWARLRTDYEIAYSLSYKVGKKYVHELYTVDIDTGATNFLFNGMNPTWSPEDNLCFEYRGLVVHDFDTGESEQINKWGYYPDWCRATNS